jgi:hypothetical protein
LLLLQSRPAETPHPFNQLDISTITAGGGDTSSKNKAVRFNPTFKDQQSSAKDRLLDTVAKVTELLRANQGLREEVDAHSRKIDHSDYELYIINQENIKLRERIEVLESFGEIIKEHSRSTAVTTTMMGKDSKTRKPLQGSLNRRVEEEDESDSEDN